MATRLAPSALAAAAAILPAACETIPPETIAAQRVRDEVVEVNGTKLAFRARGSAERTLVFLQGAQLPREMWDQQVETLGTGWTAVVYDVRGFGRSGPTTEPYSHANDLRALLDALEVEHATLVGLSLGGRIAIEFALEHPDRVDALVLVGSGLTGFPYRDGDLSWIRKVRSAVEAGDGKRAVEAWLTSDYMTPAMENREVAPRVRELALANANCWLQSDTEVPVDPPAIQRLGEIKCPTLVIVGNRDTPDILEIADRLAREIPSSRKAVMAACGHVPNLERPAEFDRIVREFLEATFPPEGP